jgi:ribonuclease HI
MMSVQKMAAIGTRNPAKVSPEQVALYDRVIGKFVENNMEKGRIPIVRTGAADFADKRAAELCLRMGGQVELVLPWSSYETDWVQHLQQRYPGKIQVRTYNEQTDHLWTSSVHKLHPQAQRLTRGPLALHARNFGIIMGDDDPVRFVVALQGAVEDGGTGQGVRIANHFGITLFNLGTAQGRAKYPREQGMEAVAKLVEGYEVPRNDNGKPIPRCTQDEHAHIDFYIDGACSGNGTDKGCMGVGVVAKCNGHTKEWSIPCGLGTNQKAEIHALIEACKKVKYPEKSVVTFHTDSQYVIGLFSKGWQAKANQELVQEGKKLLLPIKEVRFVKVAGHSGHPENERADYLAVEASQVEKATQLSLEVLEQ